MIDSYKSLEFFIELDKKIDFYDDLLPLCTKVRHMLKYHPRTNTVIVLDGKHINYCRRSPDVYDGLEEIYRYLDRQTKKILDENDTFRYKKTLPNGDFLYSFLYKNLSEEMKNVVTKILSHFDQEKEENPIMSFGFRSVLKTG